MMAMRSWRIRIHTGAFVCVLVLVSSGCVSHTPGYQADASRSRGDLPAASASTQRAQECVTLSEEPGREILSDGAEIEPGWFLASSRCGRFSVEFPARIFADGRADGLDMVGTKDGDGAKYMALCGSVNRFDEDKRTLAAVRQDLARGMRVLTEIDLSVKGGEGFEMIVMHDGRKAIMRALQSRGHRCFLLVEPTRSASYSDTAARRFLNSLEAVDVPEMASSLR
jgi:hypothetical protein